MGALQVELFCIFIFMGFPLGIITSSSDTPAQTRNASMVVDKPRHFLQLISPIYKILGFAK
jgi:hypothetical protein